MLGKVIQLAPFRGAPTTAQAIREGILASQDHYVVRQLAENAVRQLAGKDYISEYLACYYQVLKDVRYVRDPKKRELVKKPWVLAQEILQYGRALGDCDDACCLLGAELLAIGADIRIVTVAFKNSFHQGERQYSHVFLQAQEPRTGAWITLDTVAAGHIDRMHHRIVASKIYPVV